MDVAEFDQFADEYLQIHARNIGITGESAGVLLALQDRRPQAPLDGRGRPEPRSILDFGAGIGGSAAAFPAQLPRAPRSSPWTSPIAAWRSRRAAFPTWPGSSSMTARERWPRTGPSTWPSRPASSTTSTFANRSGCSAAFARLLAPGGATVIFEHNPINPVTQHIVATCEFDENAVLIPAGNLEAPPERGGVRQGRDLLSRVLPRPAGAAARPRALHAAPADRRAILRPRGWVSPRG